MIHEGVRRGDSGIIWCGDTSGVKKRRASRSQRPGGVRLMSSSVRIPKVKISLWAEGRNGKGKERLKYPRKN